MLRDGAPIAFGPTATTLSSARVTETFDVDASVTGTGRDALADFVTGRQASPGG